MPLAQKLMEKTIGNNANLDLILTEEINESIPEYLKEKKLINAAALLNHKPPTGES